MGKSSGEWADLTNQKSLDYDWKKYQDQVQVERENWNYRYGKELEASAYQSELQKSLWEATQSPQALASAGAKIGINPASMLGSMGGSVPQISPISSPSTPIASGGSPAMVGYNQQDPFLQFAEVIQSLSELGRDGVESFNTLKQLPSILGNRIADTSVKQAMSDYQEMANVVYEYFGSKQAAATYFKTFNEAVRAQAEGNRSLAEKKTLEAQSLLYDDEHKKNTALLPLIVTHQNSVIRNLDASSRAFDASAADSRSHIDVNRSQASYNRSLTDYTNELKQTEAKLRDERFEALSLSNDLDTIQRYILGNELKINDATFDAQLRARIAVLERENLITSQQAEILYQMGVSSDWAERNQFANYVGQFSDVLNNATQSYGNVMHGWSDAQRNNIRSEFNDILREQNRNNVTETYNYDAYGNIKSVNRTRHRPEFHSNDVGFKPRQH